MHSRTTARDATACLLPLLLAVPAATAGDGRYETLSAGFADVEHYRLKAATFFGGPGVDECTDAVVQADGGIAVIGNSWGPSFPAEAKVAVLGRGALVDKPSIITPPPKGGRAQKPVADEASPNRSGFLTLWNADLSAVTGGLRFDWGVATLLSAQASPDGNLYLLGTCGAAFATVQGIPTKGAGNAFIMKVAQGKPAWISRFGPAEADTRAGRMWQAGGRVYATAEGGSAEIMTRIADDGTAETWIQVARGAATFMGITDDGLALYGGDRNTHTGQEPWRQPFLYGFEKGGAKKWTWWEWASKDLRKTGHPSYGLVADSSPRNGTWDPKSKTVLITGWSDGGNSVFTRQPTDVATTVPKPASPFSTHGMKGANSLTYIMRIDPATAKIASWTYFMGYIPMDFETPANRGATSGTNIFDIESDADGNVVFTGGAATGLIQTRNAFWTYPKDGQKFGGRYAAVMSADLSTLLFSSLLPGYETARATTSGRTLVIVGRSAKDDGREKPTAPPLLKPLQKDLRGERDGHIILLQR